jgi:hypothetical protein
MATSLTVLEGIATLKPKAVDQFSSWVIDGAERALADEENPLRLNFFSTAMRILFEHMMDTLAPSDQVIQCPWFKRKEGEGVSPNVRSGCYSRFRVDFRKSLFARTCI